MAEKYLVKETAERFIHNDLSDCAWWFKDLAAKKFENDDRSGVALVMMASLVFCAFSIEAKINFVGWRVLENGWPEMASFREKIDLLNKVLNAKLTWDARPLQTVHELQRIRNAFAHGKPEVVENEKIVDVEPEVWDALKATWEKSVNMDFLARCHDDENALWDVLLRCADIEPHETLTHGGHSLSVLIDAEEAKSTNS